MRNLSNWPKTTSTPINENFYAFTWPYIYQLIQHNRRKTLHVNALSDSSRELWLLIRFKRNMQDFLYVSWCEWLIMITAQQDSSELLSPVVLLLASMKPLNSATMTKHVIWAKVCISNIPVIFSINIQAYLRMYMCNTISLPFLIAFKKNENQA